MGIIRYTLSIGAETSFELRDDLQKTVIVVSRSFIPRCFSFFFTGYIYYDICTYNLVLVSSGFWAYKRRGANIKFLEALAPMRSEYTHVKRKFRIGKFISILAVFL